MSTPTNGSNYPSDPRQNMLGFVPASVERLLDVGCNTGSFGQALKTRRAIEVWGVEPTAAAAGQAAAVLDKVFPTPFNEQIDIPPNYFDAIVFNDVLEHFEDPWAALRLAKTKLRPGGVVIASIPNIRQIKNLLHIIISRDFKYEDIGVRDRTHLRFFTRLSAMRLFHECGFDVAEVKGINVDFTSPQMVRRLIFRALASLMEDTRYQQFAFVAKPQSAPS